MDVQEREKQFGFRMKLKREDKEYRTKKKYRMASQIAYGHFVVQPFCASSLKWI